MGQQQIILIVLCVIVVGIAIAVGLIMFQAGAITANRDAIIEDLFVLAADARQYYLRPISYGGGGKSFAGYKMPAKLVNGMKENAAYTGASIPGGYQFTAVSNNYDGTIKLKVDAFHDKPFGMQITGVDFEDE